MWKLLAQFNDKAKQILIPSFICACSPLITVIRCSWHLPRKALYRIVCQKTLDACQFQTCYTQDAEVQVPMRRQILKPFDRLCGLVVRVPAC
jgi:hypothetical protein